MKASEDVLMRLMKIGAALRAELERWCGGQAPSLRAQESSNQAGQGGLGTGGRKVERKWEKCLVLSHGGAEGDGDADDHLISHLQSSPPTFNYPTASTKAPQNAIKE